MTQALHILLKDLRRHWWEIALYIASVFGWAWQKAHPNPWISSNASELFPIAMFIVWFLLVIRVVQGESLTGTREFWSTRPYRVGQLIIAKLAFLILCLNVPLAIAEYCLLKNAGLAVTPHVFVQLLLLQIEFFVLLSLPAAALAAITDSIVQWILVILGGLLFTLVVSWLPWGSLPPSLEATEMVANYAGFAVIGALLVALLVWQFHRRRPLPARILFAIAVVLVPMVVAFASTRLARSIAYPASTSAPLHLEISSLPERQYTRSDYFEGQSGIQIRVTGAASPNTVVVVQGSRFRLTGSGGWSYQSTWIRQYGSFTPETDTQAFGFSLPQSVADQLPQRGATIEADLAIAVFHLTSPQRIDTSARHFDLPDLGPCNWDERFSPISTYHSLECQMPLREPDVYTVQLDSGENTCQFDKPPMPMPAGHHASAVVFANSELPIDFDPDPIRPILPSVSIGIWQPAMYLPSDTDRRSALSAGICIGTPFVFRTGRFVQRMRVTIPLGSMGKENRVKPLEVSINQTFSPRK